MGRLFFQHFTSDVVPLSQQEPELTAKPEPEPEPEPEPGPVASLGQSRSLNLGWTQGLSQSQSLCLGQSRSLRVTPAPRRNIQHAIGVTAALLHEGPF